MEPDEVENLEYVVRASAEVQPYGEDEKLEVMQVKVEVGCDDLLEEKLDDWEKQWQENSPSYHRLHFSRILSRDPWHEVRRSIPAQYVRDIPSGAITWTCWQKDHKHVSIYEAQGKYYLVSGVYTNIERHGVYDVSSRVVEEAEKVKQDLVTPDASKRYAQGVDDIPMISLTMREYTTMFDVAKMRGYDLIFDLLCENDQTIRGKSDVEAIMAMVNISSEGELDESVDREAIRQVREKCEEALERNPTEEII
jgi:hypothetical protein